jgi:hypothetical protein
MAADTCFEQVVFDRASAGLTGEAALTAISQAYNALLDNRTVLRAQLHMWATACHDTEVRELARRRMTRLSQFAQRTSGPTMVCISWRRKLEASGCEEFAVGTRTRAGLGLCGQRRRRTG